MFREIIKHQFRVAALRRRVVASTAALVLAAICAEAGTADAQNRKRGPDTHYVVLLQYRGSGAAELAVTDTELGQEILRKRIEPGETARVRIFATVRRQTQSGPEGQIRWKVSRIADPAKALKPEDQQKPSTWCGQSDISDNRAKILVGFQGEVMGRSC